MKQYKVVNETSYSINTSDGVIKILERCRENNTRVVIDYGDVKTGESRGEINDTMGYIGRSGGEIKVPILRSLRSSWGGGAILDDCIIGIKTSLGKVTLYSWSK